MWGRRKGSKICFCGGEEELKRKRRKIFEEGKNVFAKEKINGERRRKILGRRILSFVGEKKNRKGKGGKYSEKVKIFFVRRRRTEKEERKICFCGGEEERR